MFNRGVLPTTLAFSTVFFCGFAGSLWAQEPGPSRVVSLDGTWLLAPDAKNVGRQEKWWEQSRPEAKPTRVPWIIQEIFPGYHGVAWYWRDFEAPAKVQFPIRPRCQR